MKVDPEGAGFDPERLERLTAHFRDRYVEPGKIAGCQIAVTRGGRLAYWRSLGLVDRERGRSVEDDTIWRIYSMTKPITSVALMQLYERGLFQLDDPVHRYIPAWRHLTVGDLQPDGSLTIVELHRPVSVRHALTHMTGLPGSVVPGHPADDRFNEEVHAARHGMTLEKMCALLADFPLKFQPGTRWNYGVSTDVCARLVEILSGDRFDSYLRAQSVRSAVACPIPGSRYRRSLRTGWLLVTATGPIMPPSSWTTLPAAPTCRAALVPVGCRRAGGHDRRLPPLLPDASRRWRAGWTPHHRPQDARVDDHATTSPATATLPSWLPVGSARRSSKDSVSGSVSPWAEARPPLVWPGPPVSTPGVAPLRPASGSTRSKT